MITFGDPRRFALRLAPAAPGWARPGEVWAGLGIEVAGRNITRHVVGGETAIQEVVYVDLDPLAAWLRGVLPALLHEEGSRFFPLGDDAGVALGRWRAASVRRFGREPSVSDAELIEDERREVWERRHCLRFADTGAWLPDLVIVCRDLDAILSWQPRTTAGDPPVRFVEPGGVAYVPRPEFVAALAGFLGHVAGRSITAQEVEGAAQPAWEALIAEAAPGEGEFLGALREAVAGEEPLASVGYLAARDLVPSRLIVGALGALDRATRSGSRSGHELTTGLTVTGERAEEQGYGAASALRAQLGLDGRPLPQGSLVDWLRQDCAIEDLQPLAPGDRRNRMICGARRGEAAVVGILHPADRRLPIWVERFERARALGHILLDAPSPAGALGAGGSDVAAGLRRRRSGAFAAELLMPTAGIRHRVGDTPDAAADPGAFSGLMDEFGTGATAAAQHLWNRGFLSSPSVRDDLIEEFAQAPA